MRVLCVFGKHAYGDPTRGEGYEFVNFLPALQALGHQVSFFESFAREPYSDFSHLNRALLKTIEETSPDLVLCVLMQYEVWIETIRLIRKSGPLLVNWSTDDSWKYAMLSKLIGSEFDLYVTTYPNSIDWYKRDGLASAYLSQWAANAQTLMPPLPAAACRYPVSFVGAAYGDRKAMVDKLRREGIKVACFGYGWPEGPIEAKRISEIVRSSSISLNFSAGSRGGGGSQGDRQIKARVFEVPGYGGCLLTEQAPDLDRYFRVGEEILAFQGETGLVDAVKSILAGPERRDKIAQRGFERVKTEHTYDQRFSHMLDELAKRVAPRPRRPIDWMEFEAAVKEHRVVLALRFLRSLMIFVTSLLWGRERGPRAARRLAFELSWRLVGARTYCASGWPGRMFYKES